MSLLPLRRSIALAIGVLTAVACAETLRAEAPCDAEVFLVQQEPSWIFRRGTYTHDPYTGARVAQYMRTPPVEPLDDERMVTSRYRRSRTQLRGIDGSVDTYYEVQAWGNGRGGIDAEWERFHDAWKESFLSGGYYNQGPGYYAPWQYGGGFGGAGYGYPGYGGPWRGGPHPGHGDGHHGGGGHHGGDGHHGDDEGHHDDRD